MIALGSQAAPPASGEYIMLVGGPSMYSGKNTRLTRTIIGGRTLCALRVCARNSCAASSGPDPKITWLIYRQGYEDRAKQEHQDLISLIGTVRDKFNINLVWFGPGHEVINYINNGQPRDQMKIVDFEYFGHSNRACFMFDYSNNIDSACKSWLHEDDLKQINGHAFARRAYCKSWGCHTGEEHVEKMVRRDRDPHDWRPR